MKTPGSTTAGLPVHFFVHSFSFLLSGKKKKKDFFSRPEFLMKPGWPWTWYMTEKDFELLILLPPPSNWWDYRRALLCLVRVVPEMGSGAHARQTSILSTELHPWSKKLFLDPPILQGDFSWLWARPPLILRRNTKHWSQISPAARDHAVRGQGSFDQTSISIWAALLLWSWFLFF